ncbi:RNI-like protein [Metschnikowia bicuspidata var. bicuspidata NRRL YB-4993]|uniref:RNI-like protein n=1 Tax=Metschnikowia bicuspidata var. bicuspidata NRRL YB-4993 TaxID=869754 RepID=A0A1A0HGW4_9ASCO|nr:RNI-like protein [Metschnikowia bicuspidata var. bicuspidata NRRL YB-4993]OBA23122.1 RNI-like protein [Metschnikowia bicuspidata var. bicuspidata NRRL YB-4993]
MRRSRVRGPNSALTEFLRVEGITNAFRRSRRVASTSQTPEPQLADITSDGFSDGAYSENESEEAQLRLSDDDAGREPDLFGQEEDCVDCGNPFTVTVYSRFVDALKGYICEDCNEILKKREKTARQNQANARKRRKKIAKALLDKKAVRIASLQDVCIRTITQNIGAVDVLGDIGQGNINKILKILSKNRSLNDSTATLFLNPDLTALEFWDCLNVSSDSFNKIAAYCSRLESLTLFMCGQFHNDNLTYYKDKLPHLKKLALNGPFLINDRVWQDFFDNAVCDLQQFEIRNTHRFSSESLISLLEKRGPNLTLLKLSRLDGLDSAAVYELIPEYITAGRLTTLEVSHPHKPELISDDLLIHILAITGESLRHLNVDGCTGLTDTFLVEGLAKFCPSLELLSMRNLDLLTDEGFAEAWRELAAINYGGLVNVDLTKCTGLGDRSVHALLAHSAKTLVDVSLNSLSKLTKDFWKRALDGAARTHGDKPDAPANGREPPEAPAVSFPLLTRLDVGFVRSFDDEAAEQLSRECPKLAVLEVFGNNRCTAKARTRRELLVIGRQGEDI